MNYNPIPLPAGVARPVDRHINDCGQNIYHHRRGRKGARAIFLKWNATAYILSSFLLGLTVMPQHAAAAQAPVALGSAANFGVLAGSTVTSVVSHKRLELFFLVFSHSGAGASGFDPLQSLFASAQFLDN